MEGSAWKSGARTKRFGVRVVALKQKSGIFSLALLMLAALDASGAALARPAICSVLERQLAASGSGGNSSRYARAAAAQGEQIQIARQQARSAGCGGGFFDIFGTESKPRSCSRILRTISRMEANRDALLRKRDSLSGGGFAGSRRAILASLNLNNCNGARVTKAKADRRLPAAVERDDGEQAAVFNQILEEGPVRKPRKEQAKEKKAIQKVAKQEDDSGRRPGSYIPMDANGTVRTLCVRTCDGFYFPVSFSTTKDRFSKDAAACTALCPGAEAKLYYHSIPDEEPEQMVDLTGQSYMSSPNAFKYRINGARSTPGCTCQAAQTEEVSTPEADERAAAGAKKSKKAKKWLPVPQARPDWLSDAETMANLRGGLTSSRLGGFLGRPDGAGATASLEPAKVRIVGPAFLPARPGDTGIQ
jgi:Protein of unknown function (DUF2865)